MDDLAANITRGQHMRVGIEVGGTFTDIVAVDGSRVEVAKVPSTPDSPDIGAYAAIGAAGLQAAGIADLVHGSTVATNAILERKGARIAFIITQGFRDILFLQRHDRHNIYDLHYAKPTPPVARRDCFEVAERIVASGEVIRPLDEADIQRSVLPALAGGNYDAVAICLLSAYATPVHEHRLRALIAAAIPSLRIACSYAVACEFREYERASTTALSAYVQPVIDRYLDRFEATLAEAGFRGHFSVMQSNGGRLPAVAMRQTAITALFSGPAAGVVGAIRQAARSGRVNLITFDMGGTSTDVSLVVDGEPAMAPETEIDGLPIRTPVLDIVSVGAGGGSLVWIDDGGMLRVGPRSVGAMPGSACYGRGGTEPTVTDAHVVRGTIRADAFLGDAMRLDADRAHAAFAPIAARLRTDIPGAAAAAIRLSVANIVRAMQLVSTERGRDPRDYTLLPFGGTGPLLAAEIADELGVRDILVPPQSRRHLGAWPALGRFHEGRRHHAPHPGRRRGTRGAARHIRPVPGRCDHGISCPRTRRRARFLAHRGYALRRPGLRDTRGHRTRDPAAPDRGRPRRALHGRPPPGLFPRRRARAARRNRRPALRRSPPARGAAGIPRAPHHAYPPVRHSRADRQQNRDRSAARRRRPAGQ